MVWLGHGAAAHESGNFLARDRYDASPSLATSIERTMKLNAVNADDLAHVELYSCFPASPKWHAGSLAGHSTNPPRFSVASPSAAGQSANYMSHAVVAMVQKLRGTKDKGLLFANGGYATHNHTILLSGAPTDATFPQDFDYQAEADERRGDVPPLDEDYTGPATIESYTVHYDRDGSARSGVIVAKTPDGSRTLASVPGADAGTIAFLTDGKREPVGAGGVIRREGGELAIWHRG